MNKEVELFAAEIRYEIARQMAKLGFGHVGGAMSMADLIAVLYGKQMNYDPKEPKKEDRDYLVCSKGHAGPAIYAALALKGFFPMEALDTLNQGGTILPSHCDMNLTPGIDMTTGSLGQGMSTAIGIALGNKMKNLKNTTYVILGDGELNEGQVWEGAMFAAAKKLDNIIAVVDWNKKQLDGWTKDVLDIGDIPSKWKSFGWNVLTIDGHDLKIIDAAIEQCKATKGRPSVIVMDTVKGKGCSVAEKAASNHHMRFSQEDREAIVKEAAARLQEMGGEIR